MTLHKLLPFFSKVYSKNYSNEFIFTLDNNELRIYKRFELWYVKKYLVLPIELELIYSYLIQ